MGQNLTGMGRGEKHVLFRVGVYSRSFWAGKEFWRNLISSAGQGDCGQDTTDIRGKYRKHNYPTRDQRLTRE